MCLWLVIRASIIRVLIAFWNAYSKHSSFAVFLYAVKAVFWSYSMDYNGS